MTISNDMNSFLIIFCKFFKRIMIISDKSTYFIEKWVELILDCFHLTNWNIFVTIILNRNSKFLSNFWRTIFKRLNVSLLTSIAYHAQTNEQFERTNQTVKIVIRFFITSNVDIIAVLSAFQAQLNNFFNVTTERFSNEICYEFKVRKTLSLSINSSTSTDAVMNKLQHRQEVIDAISFVSAHMKIRYDSRHKSLLLRSNDKVFLKLQKNYEINEQHKKLDNQRCESFLMKRRVDRLAYELNIFFRWKIHFVISMTQLKLANSHQNSYNRLKSNHSNSIYVESDTKTKKFYEMKTIIDKRVKKFERTSITQYKINWLEYDLEFDEWRFIFKLNCMNLIEKYEKKQLDNQRERWRHFLKMMWGYGICVREDWWWIEEISESK